MIRLYTKMLPPGTASPRFIDKITAAPVAEPIVTLYLGLDMSPGELREVLKVHHTIYVPKGGAKDLSRVDDPDLHLGTWMEVNAPCLDNPALAPEGKSALAAQTFTSYDWMENWGTGGDDSARPKRYKDLKKKVAEDMLETLENVIPGVKERVEYWDVGSPLSTIRFTLNKEGGSCAFTFDPEKAPFAKQPFQFRSPVGGLYLASQWSLWPGGIVGAAMSGKIVASRILSGYYSERTDRIHRGFLRAASLADRARRAARP